MNYFNPTLNALTSQKAPTQGSVQNPVQSPVQNPVQTTQSATNQPTRQPVVSPIQPTPSSMLQRALSGEFGSNLQGMAQSKQGTQVKATELGKTGVTAPPVRPNTTLSTLGSQTSATEAQLLQQGMQGMQGMEQPVDTRDQLLQGYMQMLGDGFQLSDEAQDLQTQAAEKKLLLDNLTTQMTQYNKETKDEEYRMLQNPEGKSWGAMEAGVQNYKYERYARPGGAADMAIEAQFALNNAEFAYEIANNAVSAEKEQYTTTMQGFKDLYNMLQNDMTTSEQMQYQSQLRLYEAEATNYMETKNVAMQRASQNGAPLEVVQGIKNAQSVEDIWAVAGTYGESPELRQQREQFNMTNALAWSKFDWDREYQQTMLDLAEQQRQGEITAKEQETKAQEEQDRRDAGVLLASVTNAQGNQLGFDAMTGGTSGFMSRVAGALRRGGASAPVGAGVGAAAAGPFGAGVGGAVSFGVGAVSGYQNVAQAQTSFANDMNFITSNNIIERLKEIRATGSWSGPMTDQDIKIIGESSRKLNAMWDTQNRQFTGNANPAEVKNELEKIQGALVRVLAPEDQQNDAISQLYR